MAKNNPLALWASVAMVGGACLFGCTLDSPECLTDGTRCVTSAAGGALPSVEKPTARELFARIENDLVTICGGCHAAQGSAQMPFLTKPNYYESMLSWPRFVLTEPAESRLLTYPRSG